MTAIVTVLALYCVFATLLAVVAGVDARTHRDNAAKYARLDRLNEAYIRELEKTATLPGDTPIYDDIEFRRLIGGDL